MTTKNGISSLIDDVVRGGTLRTDTSRLVGAHPGGDLGGDLGTVVVAGAAGADVESIAATDVTLVTLLVDASSSIHDAGLEQAVRDGQNEILAAFERSRQKDELLVALWTFSDETNVVHSYVPVDEATRFDAGNYRAHGGTRLYDVWCDALVANLAYAERLRQSGTPCRSIVVVVTDGDDCGSRRKVAACKAISEDLLASERFVLAFVGVGDPKSFERVARDMGVPSGSVAVLSKATPSALRDMFRLVSRSLIRASQGAVVPGANAGFFRP
ncbi:MAG: vWA domain-containing protein [Polyangiaceae bacterium]